MALALDGSAINAAGTATSFAVSLTTTQSNDLIVVDITSNGEPVTGVSSPTLGAFTQRATTSFSTFGLDRWYAIASSPLSAESITAVHSSLNFIVVVAYGISGANVSSPWQVASVFNAISGGGVDPLSISPTAPGMIIGTYRNQTQSSPTPGAGFTAIASLAGGYTNPMYQIVSSAGAVSVTQTLSAGDANAGIIDVVDPAAIISAALPLNAQIWM